MRVRCKRDQRHVPLNLRCGRSMNMFLHVPKARGRPTFMSQILEHAEPNHAHEAHKSRTETNFFFAMVVRLPTTAKNFVTSSDVLFSDWVGGGPTSILPQKVSFSVLLLLSPVSIFRKRPHSRDGLVPRKVRDSCPFWYLHMGGWLASPAHVTHRHRHRHRHTQCKAERTHSPARTARVQVRHACAHARKHTHTRTHTYLWQTSLHSSSSRAHR